MRCCDAKTGTTLQLPCPYPGSRDVDCVQRFAYDLVPSRRKLHLCGRQDQPGQDGGNFSLLYTRQTPEQQFSLVGFEAIEEVQCMTCAKVKVLCKCTDVARAK